MRQKSIALSTYDTVSGEFLGLFQTLGYLTVRGDSGECFLDYGYSKDKSKILYIHYKMKIPNSFSGTMFNRHRIYLFIYLFIYFQFI